MISRSEIEWTARKPHAIEALGLANARAVHARAEVVGHDPARRETFDAAAVRAVGSVVVDAELLAPLLRVGGRGYVMKRGAAAALEVEAAAAALPALGLVLERIVVVSLSGLLEDGAVVILRKVAPTPTAFPRRPGAAQRRRRP